MHRKRLGRVVILLVTLMMLAMPMVHAQVPATPISNDPVETEPANPDDGSATSGDEQDSETGETPNEGTGETPGSSGDSETNESPEGSDDSSTDNDSTQGDLPDKAAAESTPDGAGTGKTPDETSLMRPEGTPGTSIRSRSMAPLAAETATLKVTVEGDGINLKGTIVVVQPVGQPSKQILKYYVDRALTFTVTPGKLSVYAGLPGGHKLGAEDVTIEAGETKSVTITLQTPGQFAVTVTTDDGGAIPEGTEICLEYASLSECTPLTNGGTFFVPVPAGTVTYSVPVPSGSPYRGIKWTTVSVSPGESIQLNLTLESKDPAKLRVYVTTEDGTPVPDGTKVCVDLPAPELGSAVNNECQVFSGEFVTFFTGQGSADVTVTPPDGSGYVAETFAAKTTLDMTSRVAFTLQGEKPLPLHDVVFKVSLEGGAAIDPNDPQTQVCMYTGRLQPSNSNCLPPGPSQPGQNGSMLYRVPQVKPGTYNYVISTSIPGYASVMGTLTVSPDQELTESVELPKVDDNDTATLIVNVVTQDGVPAPNGLKTCAYAIGELTGVNDPAFDDHCQTWSGEPLIFEVQPDLAAVIALRENMPIGGTKIPVLDPGETREVTLTVLSPEIETGITSVVSDENPQSGAQVTYTIRAWGSQQMAPIQARSAVQYPSSFFTVSTTLPAELTDITVSCDGIYQASPPGHCGEMVDGVLEVSGSLTSSPTYYAIITITGTIVGEPGTIVSTPSCLVQAATPYLSSGTYCTTADLTIAEAPAQTANVTFDLTSSDPAAVSAMPEGSTWSLTSVAGPTITFGGTFTGAQLNLPGSVTLEEPIPYGEYLLTIDAGPVFEVYMRNVLIGQDTVALNLTKQGFFQQALPQVTFPIELQVAQVEPTETPTGTPTGPPTSTPAVTPAVPPTGTPLPSTPTPTGTPTGTQVPSTPTDTPDQPTAATPEEEAPSGTSPVTGLPTTGHNAETGTSLAIYAGLAAAILLGGAGLLLRIRQPER